jgi:Dolichyl-phosphate-mannose-protein mannosyltransferase
MRFQTSVETEETPALSSPPERAIPSAALTGLINCLSDQLDRDTRRRLSRTQFLIISVVVLLSAAGVRLLCWQDSYAELAQKGEWNSAIARHYQSEAQRMLNEGGILFPRESVDPGDARLILHPPGYSALMAGVFALAGDSISSMRLLQVVADGLSAVLVLLIAAELLPAAIAIIAALLVVLSPHFAFYSLWISPDTLCVLPVLVAIYLIIRAHKRPRITTIIAAGAMIGVSCWLRANALLLAPFLAAVVFLTFDRAKRLAYAMALVVATVLVISPITIRNWILFHHFIPVSIAGGENLVVGIADYDREDRFGMPRSDIDAAAKDALWHNQPEYAQSPWLPDGVERDRARYSRGLEVIRANPGWFLGVMFQRALFMLNYNDSSTADWPFNTSRVPVVSDTPPPMHLPARIGVGERAWSALAPSLLAEGSLLSPQARASLDSDQRLRITGDGSEFGVQFASAGIAVKSNNDYVLRLSLALEEGMASARVMSSDRAIGLASAIITGRERRLRLKTLSGADNTPTKLDPKDRMAVIDVVFASDARSEVRLVISNNGAPGAILRLDKVELYDLGATPYRWTRYPRALINQIQKSLFDTSAMLPLVVAGLLLLGLARRGRALLMLLAVPAYYLCVQSALSTEYRYTLAIHYFLFVIAATALYCASLPVVQLARYARTFRTDLQKR